MQIFLLQDGEKTGPFTVYEVASQVRDGEADGETLGWYQGADGWLPLRKLPAVETVFSEPETPRVDLVEQAEKEGFAFRQLRSSTRFWARVTDISIVHSLIGITAVLTGMMHPGHWDPGNNTSPNFGMMLLPAAVVMFLDTILLHLFGTTLGKWLLRISIKTKSGGRIPLRTAFKRSFTVWWRGIGFWIPGINLITMILAQTSFLRDGYTPWDDACDLEVEYGKVDRWRIYLVIGLIIGLVIVLNLIVSNW